jgi:lipoate-protein ligase A
VPDVGPLRVIDFGRASPLRSQTVWHAIAHGVSAGEPATLSFVRPSAPYVGIGYHRHLDEVDEKYCQATSLPIYRRMVGGGPVYLDADQLFFQICVPARAVSPARLVALRDLLTPAVVAFRAAGVAAELDANLEIRVGDRKVCGHGAGQIEDAVVVCGNLLERFDHERASRILRLPDGDMRAEVEHLMRRYVQATPAEPETFKQALIVAYAMIFGVHAFDGELGGAERAELDRLDALFESPEWLAGPGGQRAMPAGVRQVKIKSGVWAFAADEGSLRVLARVVDDVVTEVRLRSERLSRTRRAVIEQALAGVPLRDITTVLAGVGGPGTRSIAAAFARADGRTI